MRGEKSGSSGASYLNNFLFSYCTTIYVRIQFNMHRFSSCSKYTCRNWIIITIVIEYAYFFIFF